MAFTPVTIEQDGATMTVLLLVTFVAVPAAPYVVTARHPRHDDVCRPGHGPLCAEGLLRGFHACHHHPGGPHGVHEEIRSSQRRAGRIVGPLRESEKAGNGPVQACRARFDTLGSCP